MSRTPDGVIDLVSARVRVAQAEAVSAELQAAIARREVITVDEFHDLVLDGLRHASSKLLALAPEIAPLAFRATTVAETEAVIHDAIAEALEELADEADAAMADDDPANDPRPAA